MCRSAGHRSENTKLFSFCSFVDAVFYGSVNHLIVAAEATCSCDFEQSLSIFFECLSSELSKRLRPLHWFDSDFNFMALSLR